MNRRKLPIDDILLGSAGATIPPSHTLDHAVRYFSTWGGTDKLLMTSQYSIRLLAPWLIYRAQHLSKAGKHEQLLNTDGLAKFASQLSIARRIMGFWGLLSIFKSLSALERTPPKSRLLLNLQRLQGLSMLVFYPLEYISFFSAPFAPLLRISPSAATKAGLWSVRAWGVFVALRVVELLNELDGIMQQESHMTEDALKAAKHRKRAIIFQLVANVSRLPVIVHWSVIGGIYKNEIWTNALSLLSALAAFRGGWEGHKISPPAR